MSLIHSQSEQVLVEHIIPPEPPITVVAKNFPERRTPTSNVVGSVRVRNDDTFYEYRVWMLYRVSGVGEFTTLPVRLRPGREDLLFAEFNMPESDVTINIEIYAEVVRG